MIGAWVKWALTRVFGEQTIGVMMYVLLPGRRAAWGGPFNGQAARQALFQSIVAATQPRAIVETGTYLGTTTEVLAQTGLPVFTIEAHPRYYAFSRVRFRRQKTIRLLRGDSRSVLRELFAGPLRPHAGDTLFFYLDAHWNADLPLAEELDIVFGGCPSAVVMVDDFQVPHDPGYVYDDYGPGKALKPAYIGAAAAQHGLQAFYPSTASAAETGARRGCVVLAKRSVHGAMLAALALLRAGGG